MYSETCTETQSKMKCGQSSLGHQAITLFTVVPICCEKNVNALFNLYSNHSLIARFGFFSVVLLVNV